jgi:uncharacterized protein YchJ
MPPTRDAARALAAGLSALACLSAHGAPAQAQVQRPPYDADAQDSFYCEERKLGYWFYCTRPKTPEQTAPAAAPSATNQLDAITATLRELKAKAILEPTPANVTAYIRFGEKIAFPWKHDSKIARMAGQLGKSAAPSPMPLRRDAKIGRNTLCPCGSGKKYKKCHGR